MQLVLEPTETFERINGCMCRVWQGWTDTGADVLAYVAVVSPQTHDAEVNAAFARELNEVAVTSRRVIMADIETTPLNGEVG